MYEKYAVWWWPNINPSHFNSHCSSSTSSSNRNSNLKRRVRARKKIAFGESMNFSESRKTQIESVRENKRKIERQPPTTRHLLFFPWTLNYDSAELGLFDDVQYCSSCNFLSIFPQHCRCCITWNTQLFRVIWCTIKIILYCNHRH